jgi:hypothetical protein
MTPPPSPNVGDLLARLPKNPQWTRIALVALLLATGCSKAPTDAPLIDPAADAVVAAARSRFEASAQVAATNDVIAVALQDADRENLGPLQLLAGLAPDDQRSLAGVLRRRLQDATRPIAADNDRLRGIRDPLVSEWRTCSDERLAQAKLADATERDARKAQQTALVLGTENRWFWLSGLIAVASLFAVFALDRRHEIRRYLNGGTARDLGLGRLLIVAFALMATVTAALFFASDGLLVDLLGGGGAGTQLTRIEQQRADDVTEAARKAADLQAKRTDLAAKKSLVETRIAPLVPADVAGPLLDDWWAYWQAATENRGLRAEIATIADRFSKDKQDVDPAGADSLAAGINANRKTAASWRRGANLIAGLIGAGLLSLVAGGFAWYLRGVSRRTRDLAQTCPLCLAKGKLTADDRQAGMVRCHNVILESPFEECNFDFPEMFREVSKLSFPTLGVPQSGKTHWLAMVYRQLNQGADIPDNVEFAKIRSRASEDFDSICEDLLRSKVGPAATQDNVLPHPLVFNFVDQDRLGRSNLLVSIFDYSGEVLRTKTLEDHQRRRAFTADGYFFFLDPTKESDEQISPLTNFRQDVRTVKKLRAGQQLHCPVALCVPKIDLMTAQRYADPAGGDSVDHFYREIGEIGWGMDQDSIRGRSTLMRNLRDTIWPGWEIEKTIDDIFGGRYMFFPFTPVGLDGMGQDWTDGSRPIAPVGILHPLMWLLHMNGYPLLPRASQA